MIIRAKGIRRATLVSLMGAAFLVIGCGGSNQIDYESKEHKFKVKMPGTPKVQKQDTIHGQQTTYTVEGGNCDYMVLHQVLPIAAVGPEETMLEGGVKALASKGSIKTKSAIKLEGKHPGVEVHAAMNEPEGGEIKTRIYIVGNTLYQVLVMGPASCINTDAAKKFMDSFQTIP